MNTVAKVGIGIGSVVVLGGIAVGLGLFGGPSDKEQIQTALDEAIQASKEGRQGGVVEYISNKFQVNNEQFRHSDISKAIKEMRPSVEIPNREPSISGSIASITSQVKLSVTLPPVSMNLNGVKMTFEKESATRWLIFPTKKWRLSQVEIPEATMNDVREQFGGMTQL